MAFRLVHTSLVVGELAVVKLKLPSLCTTAFPTASTAPLGLRKLMPPPGDATTLNNLTDVPVQMPLTPLLVVMSLA